MNRKTTWIFLSALLSTPSNTSSYTYNERRVLVSGYIKGKISIWPPYSIVDLITRYLLLLKQYSRIETSYMLRNIQNISSQPLFFLPPHWAAVIKPTALQVWNIENDTLVLQRNDLRSLIPLDCINLQSIRKNQIVLSFLDKRLVSIPLKNKQETSWISKETFTPYLLIQHPHNMTFLCIGGKTIDRISGATYWSLKKTNPITRFDLTKINKEHSLPCRETLVSFINSDEFAFVFPDSAEKIKIVVFRKDKPNMVREDKLTSASFNSDMRCQGEWLLVPNNNTISLYDMNKQKWYDNLYKFPRPLFSILFIHEKQFVLSTVVKPPYEDFMKDFKAKVFTIEQSSTGIVSVKPSVFTKQIPKIYPTEEHYFILGSFFIRVFREKIFRMKFV